MVRTRELLNKNMKLIEFIIKISRVLPKKIYLSLLKTIRGHDNYLAMFLRYICLRNCAKSCGKNVAVFSDVYLYNVDKLEIGDNVSIHPMCYINASGEISIGDNVSIAHNTTILSEEHKYSDLRKNIKDQGLTFKKTIIKNNVWIGAGCRILSGTMIEEGSVIAAAAVVKNKVSANSIMAGVPARQIRERR